MVESHKTAHVHHALRTDEFKERCLELIAEIYQEGGSLIVADGDGPAVEITRYVQPPLGGYGSLKGVEILGDIEGPMPVEWYTDPNVLTDDDWDISGPMPASWFIEPDEVKSREYRMPETVDVSILHRHKFLTVNTGEFTAQLDEIIAAVSESEDGKVAIFDNEKPLVQIKRFRQIPVRATNPSNRKGFFDTRRYSNYRLVSCREPQVGPRSTR